MSANSNFRFRRGEQQTREYAYDNTVAIAKGDILWWDSSDRKVKTAYAYTWDTNLATTQTSFALVFVGIACDDRDVSDTKTTITVDVSPEAEYVYPRASGTHSVNTPFAVAQNGSDSLLANQKLVAVTESQIARAVARSIESQASAVTSVMVQFASTVYIGSGSPVSVLS